MLLATCGTFWKFGRRRDTRGSADLVGLFAAAEDGAVHVFVLPSPATVFFPQTWRGLAFTSELRRGQRGSTPPFSSFEGCVERGFLMFFM